MSGHDCGDEEEKQVHEARRDVAEEEPGERKIGRDEAADGKRGAPALRRLGRLQQKVGFVV